MARLLSLLAIVVSLSVRAARAMEGEAPRPDPWFVRISTIDALYHPGATIATSAGVFPGATATLNDNLTVGFDVGYHVSQHLTATLALGIPPQPTISGEGAISGLGTLGRVRYGPAILTLCYRARVASGLEIYAGPGAGYAIILKERDAAVRQLAVRNNWGFVLQGGAERRLSRRWDLYADFKYMWIDVDASGLLAGTVPFTARVRLDPALLSVGLKLRLP